VTTSCLVDDGVMTPNMICSKKTKEAGPFIAIAFLSDISSFRFGFAMGGTRDHLIMHKKSRREAGFELIY